MFSEPRVNVNSTYVERYKSRWTLSWNGNEI